MAGKDSRRTVRVFAAATFRNDMGSDMTYPIWPLFVTAVMVANITAWQHLVPFTFSLALSAAAAALMLFVREK